MDTGYPKITSFKKKLPLPFSKPSISWYLCYISGGIHSLKIGREIPSRESPKTPRRSKDRTLRQSLVQPKWKLKSKFQLGVSKNRGTPKSSILIRFSIINHPFWSTPIFGNTQLFANQNLKIGHPKNIPKGNLIFQASIFWGQRANVSGRVGKTPVSQRTKVNLEIGKAPVPEAEAWHGLFSSCWQGKPLKIGCVPKESRIVSFCHHFSGANLVAGRFFDT